MVCCWVALWRRCLIRACHGGARTFSGVVAPALTLSVLACDTSGPKSLLPPKPPGDVPPASSAQTRDVRSVEVSAAPSLEVSDSQCHKTAARLFKVAKQCGIPVGDRTPTKTCSELLNDEKFVDDKAVARLEVFMRNGCEKLKLAIDNDRI